MNYKILKLTLALFGVLLLSNTDVNAQLETEFKAPVIRSVNDYNALNISDPSVFRVRKSDFENAGGFLDPDDGYYKVDLNFEYQFSDVLSDEMWVSVNGFVTFVEPLNQPQDRPEGLFSDGPVPGTYQQYVVAPFWGDHYYRNVDDQPLGYVNSDVLIDNNDEYVTVEWKNLNINDPSIPSSVGNFQVTIYKAENSATFATQQGNIEFSYGLVNGSSGAVVITDGASIGAKATGSDYINGLCWDPDDNSCDPFGSQELSNVWQPSGGTNRKILLGANQVIEVPDEWGDGDSDLSQGVGERHEGLVQNRFVTFNDVRLILRSVVEDTPLDSAIGRNAYHADVDHDGRYYRVDTTVWARNSNGIFIDANGDELNYLLDSDNDGLLDDSPLGPAFDDPDNEDGPGPLTWIFYSTVTDLNNDSGRLLPDGLVVFQDSVLSEKITIRSRRFQDDLPSKVSRISSELYFEADEDDAKWITTYLRASIPSLPWIYDTLSNGKINYVEQIANDIELGEPSNYNGTYKIPLYTNGISIEGLSTYLELDENIESVEVVNNEDPFAIAEFENNRFTFVGSGIYNSNDPFAYIYVSTENDQLNVQNVRLNDENANNKTLILNQDIQSSSSLASYPSVFNPIDQSSTIELNINEDGYYTLQVYNMNGDLVNTIYEGTLDVNTHEFTFEGKDNNNKYLNSGVYLYKLDGPNSTETTKVIIER